MTQRKILIPESMRLAAGRATSDVDPEGYIVYPALEAALLWLAENPILPTVSQIRAEAKGVNELEAAFHVDWIRWWQCRMFLPREPSPVVAKVERALTGCTLTREEADEIMEYVNQCAPPREED